MIVYNITQVNGTSIVAEDVSSDKKPKISIVINEERYDFNFVVLPVHNVTAPLSHIDSTL